MSRQQTSNNAAEPMTSNTILDLILEKASNIEQETSSTKIQRTLNEAIRLNSRRERDVRASTISIKIDPDCLTRESIENYVDEWLEKESEAPASVWQDQSTTYVQFTLPATRNKFLEQANSRTPGPLVMKQIAINLQQANIYGEHFTRKPVRLEINNLKAHIDTEQVKKILETMAGDNSKITEFKESKNGASMRTRSVYFRVDQSTFSHLFKLHDGQLPYCSKKAGKTTKDRLYIKINAKPYQCRDCFKIGPHKCQGKICGQCSKPGHETRECKQTLSYCDNCSWKGHKCRDTHCPYYLNEVAKELRKMDIPLCFLENDDERFALVKHLRIK